MSEAFDSDVLISLVEENTLAPSIRRAVNEADGLLGSVVLFPELLSKPMRMGAEGEYADLAKVLALFDLKEVDLDVALAATTLGAKYGLRAADAIHLATAVVWGAERFHTNNRKDFGPHITEVDVVWPTTR